MLGLRKVSAATSALLLPWVISARISASRSVRPSPPPGPVERRRSARARAAASLMTRLAGVHRLQGLDQLAGGQRLGQVAVRAALVGRSSTRSGWKFQV